MGLQVEKMEKNMAKLTIEVSVEELEKAIEKAYQKNKKNISLPGFRKGKAPRFMIEKMYGKGVFLEEAANALIPGAYYDAADESKLEIVSRPEIDVVQLEPGMPFIFTAEVAVKPEVTLGEYKGLEVPANAVEVTEEELEARLKQEQENNSRTIPVEDRAVQDGDMVQLDFEGFVDGVAFQNGKGENYPLTIGSNTFIPGFEEQLVGANIGEDKEVHVTFPEDYHAADLAGKEAVFQCKINKIEQKELPALDDEFAMDVSEFDTLEEYKADLRKQLTEKKEEEARQAREDAALEKAVANATMEIPDAMLETQVQEMLNDFSSRLQMQGMSFEQYCTMTGATKDTLEEQMRPQAMKRIQSRLVLEAIAKAEDIHPTEEQMEEEIGKMAGMYRMEADKLKEMMTDPEREQIEMDLAVRQAAALLAETAKEV